MSTIKISKTVTNELDTLEYDLLVLCTGGKYKEPIKAGINKNIADRKNEMALEKEEIKVAKSILVVGGGPVGVELMAELAHHFSKEKTSRSSIVQEKKKL